MTTAAEFWAKVQPSGLTAEQELIEFWQRMRDCKCKHHGVGSPPPPSSRRRHRDREDDVLVFLLR